MTLGLALPLVLLWLEPAAAKRRTPTQKSATSKKANAEAQRQSAKLTTAQVLAGWQDAHPDAASSLTEWSNQNAPAAEEFFAWDGRTGDGSRVFIEWALNVQTDSAEAFSGLHPEWKNFVDLLHREPLAFDRLMRWCREHPKAAAELEIPLAPFAYLHTKLSAKPAP